jgi:hypothetical protein
MNLPNADDCCRAPAALANEAPVAQDGPYPSPELVPSQPGRSRGRTHRHAISVPFRARRHRFVTVSHGHSRSSDLQRPYYRCVAARMVRMGSLDRPLGPHRGHTPPESHGQHRTTAATQHRSSAVLLDQHRRSTDHPTSLSHGGSQGFKSPHLHPQPRRSERRQRPAGGAHRMLGPRWGRERPWEGVRRRLGSGCRSWSTVRATLRLTGSTTCTPGRSLSLLGVQLQSPVGALAERLA